MGLGKSAGFDQRKGRRASQRSEHTGQRSGSREKGGLVYDRVSKNITGTERKDPLCVNFLKTGSFSL